MNLQKHPARTPILLACIFLPIALVLGIIAEIQHRPGPEATTLAKEMQSLVGQSFETAEVRYGKPDRTQLIQVGTVYLFYTYLRRDGQVTLKGSGKTGGIESVEASRSYP